jgi:hypothetical protein
MSPLELPPLKEKTGANQATDCVLELRVTVLRDGNQ